MSCVSPLDCARKLRERKREIEKGGEKREIDDSCSVTSAPHATQLETQDYRFLQPAVTSLHKTLISLCHIPMRVYA